MLWACQPGARARDGGTLPHCCDLPWDAQRSDLLFIARMVAPMVSRMLSPAAAALACSYMEDTQLSADALAQLGRQFAPWI